MMPTLGGMSRKPEDNAWFSRKRTKRTPPAKPANTRVYSPDEVIEQFKYRLGGLDVVEVCDSGVEHRIVQTELGYHISTLEIPSGPITAKDLADHCAVILRFIRDSIQGNPSIA